MTESEKIIIAKLDALSAEMRELKQKEKETTQLLYGIDERLRKMDIGLGIQIYKLDVKVSKNYELAVDAWVEENLKLPHRKTKIFGKHNKKHI